jgi:FkbM family methyltransferase
MSVSTRFSRRNWYLKDHLRLNHVANVEVIEAAVSNKAGVLSFDEGPASTMGHLSMGGALNVKCVVLDELVSRGELPAPDFMKIDIEGAETLALSGAKSTIGRSHPTIFLATHGDAVHEECCRLLESLGYRLEPIDGLALPLSSELLATPDARSKTA